MNPLDSVKTLIKLPARLVSEAVEALKDGWQWTDAVKFLDEAMMVPAFIKALPEAGKRISEGLSYEDLAELEAYAEEQLKIPNEKVKVFVGKLVAWAGLTYEIFMLSKDLKEEPASPETPTE